VGLILYFSFTAVLRIRDILLGPCRIRIRNIGTFISFFKEKIHKVEIKVGFSYYFGLMMEGSEAGAGSVLVNNGSGSGSGTLLSGIASVRA
jgi:hypothetical protein